MGITVIESQDYRDEIEKLKADPIIRDMAFEIPADFEVKLTHEFMGRAGAEYRDRGGTQARTIGGPARAVIAVIDDLKAAGFR